MTINNAWRNRLFPLAILALALAGCSSGSSVPPEIAALPISQDTDQDGIPNSTDDDDDNDGVLDVDDAFPLDNSESIDSDADGVGDNADADDDNDNTVDTEDDFPLNPARTMPIQPLFPVVNDEFQLPDWPSTRQLAWFLEQIEGPSTTIADIEAHYAPSTLAVVPAVDIQAGIDSLRGIVTDGRIVDILVATPTRIQLMYGNPSDPANPGLFMTINTRLLDGGLLLGVSAPTIPVGSSSVSMFNEGQTMEEAATRLTELTENASVLVASIDEENMCQPILEVGADVPRPLAQNFQALWVIGALAQQVDAGTISIDQEVPLETDTISTLGALGFEPPDMPVPLRDIAAIAMDGEPTAVDTLMKLVGRDAIEAALPEFGHQNIDQVSPFLHARDYHNLVFRVTETEATGYVSGTEDEQRTFVDTVLAPLGPYNLVVAPPFRNQAVHVSGLMQSSANDVCGAIARLRQFNDRSDAFSLVDGSYGGRSGGLAVRGRWERVWASFGVTGSAGAPFRNVAYNFSYLLESDDSGAYVVIVTGNNADDSQANTPFIPAFSPINRIIETIEESL